MAGRFYDGSITTPQVASPLVPEYPFDGDLASAIYRQTYHVDRDSYAPLALNTPNTSITNAYLVNEGKIEHIGGGILSFERVWANVPRSRNEFEAYAWNRPGFSNGEDMFTGYASNAYRNGGADYIIVNGTFYVGQQVTIRQLPYTQFGVGIFANNTVVNSVRSVIGLVSGGFYVSLLPSAPVATLDVYNNSRTIVMTAAANRPEKSIVCKSRVVYDYFLPGVTPKINSPNDIEINQRIFFYTNSGSEVNSLNNYDSSAPLGTVPTINEYRTWMTSGRELIPESSGLARWMGNIWERRTRYIRAE